MNQKEKRKTGKKDINRKCHNKKTLFSNKKKKFHNYILDSEKSNKNQACLSIK